VEHTAVVLAAVADSAQVVTFRKVPDSIPVVRGALFSILYGAAVATDGVLYLSTDLRLAQQATFPVGVVAGLQLGSVFAHSLVEHSILSSVGVEHGLVTLAVMGIDVDVPGDIVAGLASGLAPLGARVDIYYEYRPASAIQSLAIARRAAVSARGATRL